MGHCFVSEFNQQMPPTSEFPEADLSWDNSTVSNIISTMLQDNSTLLPTDSTVSPYEEQKMKKMHEFQIIKAVVLAVVTVIIMFSVCKMVFQLFIRYSGKQDDR